MNETYHPGTRHGEGITFQRTDDERIQKQKEKIALLIDAKMKEKGYSLRDLEKKTNVYHNQIHNIVKNKTNYRIDTLLRILVALDNEKTNPDGSFFFIFRMFFGYDSILTIHISHTIRLSCRPLPA